MDETNYIAPAGTLDNSANNCEYNTSCQTVSAPKDENPSQSTTVIARACDSKPEAVHDDVRWIALATAWLRNDENVSSAHSNLCTTVSSFVGSVLDGANNLFKSLDPYPHLFVFPGAEGAAVARMPSYIPPSTSSSSFSSTTSSSFNTNIRNTPVIANDNYRAPFFQAPANDNFARANTFQTLTFGAPPVNNAPANPLFNSPLTPPIGTNPYGPGAFQLNVPLNPYSGHQQWKSVNSQEGYKFDLSKGKDPYDNTILDAARRALDPTHRFDPLKFTTSFSNPLGTEPQKPSYLEPLQSSTILPKFDPLASIQQLNAKSSDQMPFNSPTSSPSASSFESRFAQAQLPAFEINPQHLAAQDAYYKQLNQFWPTKFRKLYIPERLALKLQRIIKRNLEEEILQQKWLEQKANGKKHFVMPSFQERFDAVLKKLQSDYKLLVGYEEEFALAALQCLIAFDPESSADIRLRLEERARDMTNILASLIHIANAFGKAGISIDWSYIHNILNQLSPETSANVFQNGIAAEVLLEKARAKQKYGEQERASSAGGDNRDPCNDSAVAPLIAALESAQLDPDHEGGDHAGHTGEKHIWPEGTTLEQETARLSARFVNEPLLKQSSSFLNQDIAQMAYREALRQNRNAVCVWLKSGAASRNFQVSFLHQIGVGLGKDDTIPTPRYQAKFRFKQTPDGPKVFTGFPI